MEKVADGKRYEGRVDDDYKPDVDGIWRIVQKAALVTGLAFRDHK